MLLGKERGHFGREFLAVTGKMPVLRSSEEVLRKHFEKFQREGRGCPEGAKAREGLTLLAASLTKSVVVPPPLQRAAAFAVRFSPQYDFHILLFLFANRGSSPAAGCASRHDSRFVLSQRAIHHSLPGCAGGLTPPARGNHRGGKRLGRRSGGARA